MIKKKENAWTKEEEQLLQEQVEKTRKGFSFLKLKTE